MPAKKLSLTLTPLTVSERSLMYNMNQIIRNLSIINPLMNKLIYTSKTGDDGKKEYGYYVTYSDFVPEVISILKHFGKNSLMDLGCGMGVFLKQIKALYPELRVFGIDNEHIFIKFAENLQIEAKECDLEQIGYYPETVAKCSAFYMWEPIIDLEKGKRFIDNLTVLLKKGAIIIYNPAGKIGDHLKATKQYQEWNINFGGAGMSIYVYEKL